MSWMLESLVELPEVRHALVVSADGLQLGRSSGLGRDRADTDAAAISSLQSLSRTMATFCGNPMTIWRQTVIDFDDGFVILAAAGAGAYLGISTSNNADLEVISFRMQQLVGQIGRVLTSPPRESIK